MIQLRLSKGKECKYKTDITKIRLIEKKPHKYPDFFLIPVHIGYTVFVLSYSYIKIFMFLKTSKKKKR